MTYSIAIRTLGTAGEDFRKELESLCAQTVQPDSGYDYLSAVTVAAIPYTESDNAAGGKTVTIGG